MTTDVAKATAVRKMINDYNVKEFDVEQLMDLFGIDPEDGKPWEVCNVLTQILIDLDLNEPEKRRAKQMFTGMVSGLAAFLCDNVI